MSELVCLRARRRVVARACSGSAFAGNAEFGLEYLLSPRDAQPPVKGVACGRATRALNNYIEGLVPFVALALALIATGKAGGLGATIWIIARILYLPSYVMGITYLRTALWGISVIGVLMMLARLMFTS